MRATRWLGAFELETTSTCHLAVLALFSYCCTSSLVMFRWLVAGVGDDGQHSVCWRSFFSFVS